MCALETNAKRAGWSRRYRTALRKYLKQGQGCGLDSAETLGRQAVTLRIETLDVATIHDRALTTVASAGGPSKPAKRVVEQAKIFFVETIVPIEASHRAAKKTDMRIRALTRKLSHRTKASSFSSGQLKEAIAQRQAAEALLKKIADQHARLLVEAQGLQEHLRQRTRRMLSAQERERKETSCELRNEIAQALLAIDLSLVALRTATAADAGKLENGIANAQRLVQNSTRRGGRRSPKVDL